MVIHGEPPVGPSGTPLPLSVAVEAGGLVFLSGQVPLVDGVVRGADITEQAAVVLDGIADTLARAGLGLGHVVKATVWLVDAADFPAFNRVYVERFAAPYPARSTVVSARWSRVPGWRWRWWPPAGSRARGRLRTPGRAEITGAGRAAWTGR